jgi:predicted transcriptional regulator
MIHVDNLKDGLPIFRALSSDVRTRILKLLVEHNKLNMSEIARRLGMSNGALTVHIKKLEDCKIIEVQTATGRHGTQKICHLYEDKLIVDLRKEDSGNLYEVEIDVGHYSNYQVLPTCGLVTKKKIIGELDDPRYFAAPERINACMLWFTKGFIEYRIPNYLKPGQRFTEFQFSFELCSEAPGYCDDWPSDIHFSLNDHALGYWTSPGDLGDVKGIFTPSWWLPNWGKYGLLKLLSINSYGAFIDGLKISDVNLDDINVNNRSNLTLKLSVPESARNVGGLSIFGRGCGNYDQSIKARIYFENVEHVVVK